MAEITESGVTGTSLNEYLTAMRARYLDIDDAWNINPESPDGLQIAAWCESLANLDEQVTLAYQSVDPESAIGQQLDRIASFSGLTRRAATPSTATVTFTGTDGTSIPAGTEVRNPQTDTLWSTDSVVVIASGEASVGVTSQDSGAITAAPGALSVIATPVGGVQSVTNDSAASLGLEEEQNDAFRVRRNNSVALPGNSQLDNMYAAIADTEGVKQVTIYENEESAIDADGVEGHSLAIFADGGTDADVLSAIAAKKNPGVGLNRDNTFPNKVNGDAETPAGQRGNFTFYRPELITVYAHVTIASTELSEEDKDLIRSEVVSYSLLGFACESGFNRDGFRIGEGVAAGRLYTPVNYIVAGSGYVQSIQLGLTALDITAAFLPMSINQLGVLDADSITVEYV